MENLGQPRLKILGVLFLIGSGGLSFYAHRVEDSLSAGGPQRATQALLNQPAPDFSVPTLETSAESEPAPPQVTLSDYRGKVVLLSFWASWCRPCDYELPVLNQFYLAHRERGVAVLAISTDEKRDDALAYAQSRHLALPMLWDDGGQVGRLYHVDSLPTLVVIDPQGRVQQYEQGLRYDLESWLTRQVTRLLPGASPPPAGTS
ncbi:MAG: TlpA family protein disulfide reductase [Candidatus Acidiferrales bacterium]